MSWNMVDVLPAEGGITINGIFYRYTVDKIREDDMTVTIRNEDASKVGEYIWSETDDWSGVDGTTIIKIVPLNNTSATLFGDGEINVEGTGTVKDPSVIYSYIYDKCYIPLSDPSCPGYMDALYQWLKDNGLLDKEPNPNDPYYDEWVQWQLNQKVEKDDEELESEQAKKEETEEAGETLEARLGISSENKTIADAATQTAIMNALTSAAVFDQYYVANIPGGVYTDALKYEDKQLPDNRNGLRMNFAQDRVHREMIDSQYERINSIGEN